jgi:chromosome segregation ATPase
MDGILKGIMNTRIVAIILAVVCVGLAVGLFSIKKQAGDQKVKDDATITVLSSNVVDTEKLLTEQRQVNIMLTNDLVVRKSEIATLTDKLAGVSNTLGEVSMTLDQTRVTLKTKEEDLAKRDARIAELVSQNVALDQRALELGTDITNLTTQIEDTRKKLAASEGDKAFLEKELQRLIAEKAELERQFNDLKVLRAQVAKLKEELDISRRLDWIRKGLFAADDQKGSQQLLQRGPTAPSAALKPERYDLNVEVNADGSLRVIEPLTNHSATNPPSAK